MIYADHNATTPMVPEVLEAMQQAFEVWGNPSSTHLPGRKAKEMLEKHRKTVAESLGVLPDHLVFTSGGTEANAMVILGKQLVVGPEFRLLTSAVEHSSVAKSAEHVRELGSKVKYVKLLASGELDLEAFEKQVETFKPHLVSLMAANNETGICFPMAEISEICKKNGVCFHTDGVQAFGKLAPQKWNQADFVSVSAHKIYGPKGIGALAMKSESALKCIVPGGSQEIKRRAGTQNMPGIFGFGAACRVLADEAKLRELKTLRDLFETELKSMEGISIIGENTVRVPNTSSVRVHGIGADILLSAFDMDGFYVSSGSACSSGSIAPSRVLLAMGLENQAASECLRISWGISTTKDSIHQALALIKKHVERIRARRQQKLA